MFMCQVTGKMSDFVPEVEAEGGKLPAYCTITEKVFSHGEETTRKHFLFIRDYNKAFVQKCIEKNWTVIVFAENPRVMQDLSALNDGYVLSLHLTSVQLP